MKPDELAEFDQNAAKLRESLPTMWWAVYSGCVDKGFTAEQSLVILLEFMRGISKSASGQ